MSFSLDDTASLKKKIDRRSDGLFAAIEGRAGLQVTRKNGINFVKNQDVWDEKQLEQVRNVRNSSTAIKRDIADPFTRLWTTSFRFLPLGKAVLGRRWIFPGSFSNTSWLLVKSSLHFGSVCLRLALKVRKMSLTSQDSVNDSVVSPRKKK